MDAGCRRRRSRGDVSRQHSGGDMGEFRKNGKRYCEFCQYCLCRGPRAGCGDRDRKGGNLVCYWELNLLRNRTFFFLFFVACATGLVAQQYDVLIRNGRVVDGSGNPWVYADVGIIGDRIAFVGKADPNVTAKRTIDATGLIVAPGFIDRLGQSETNLLIDKQAISKLTQGITTEITGEGDSIAPTNDVLNQEHADFLAHFHLTVDWQSLEEYFQRLTRQGSGINLATHVGAAQVRHMVIGTVDRAPTSDELKQMEIMVDDAMS